MGKRHNAVRRSGRMQEDETILGDEQAIFTIASGKHTGGFVVQADRAIYICLQGALGVGRVKAIHRLAVSDVLAQHGGHGRVSRDTSSPNRHHRHGPIPCIAASVLVKQRLPAHADAG